MTYLFAILGTGKGSWATLAQLVRQGNFERVILVTNQFGKEKFTPDAKTDLLVTNFDQPIATMRDDIKQKIQPLLQNLLDTDVAVNLVSGAGPEHMALLSAIIQSGLGIRFVATEPNRADVIEI